MTNRQLRTLLLTIGLPLVLVVVAAIAYHSFSGRRGDEKTITIGSRTYSIRVESYDPPLRIDRPLLAASSDASFDTPEDAHLAQLSATSRESFLACFDEYSRKIILEVDEAGGTAIGTMLEAAKGPWPPQEPDLYTMWASAGIDGRDYAFLGVQTPEMLHLVLVFVHENGQWLRTFRLDGHELTRRLMGDDQEDLVLRPARLRAEPGEGEASEASPPISFDARVELMGDIQARIREAVAALREGRPDKVEEILDAVSEPAAVPVLLELIVDDEITADTRRFALRALMRNGSTEAVSTVLDEIRTSADPRFLAFAASAMSEIGNPDALPLLLVAALDGTDDRLHRACLKAISRLPGSAPTLEIVRAYREGLPAAVPLLVGLGVETPSCARAAAFSLATLATKPAILALLDWVKGGEDGLRGVAAEALAFVAGEHAEDESVMSSVLSGLGSDSRDVRLAVVGALRNVADHEEVRAALETAAESETDEAVAAAIEAALER